MIAFVSIIHALTCVFIVIFILLQDPKGGVLGSLGGGGGSRSFFGAEGASPFLVNGTKWLAILFACSSFYLSYMSSKRGSVMDDLSQNPPVSSSSKTTGNKADSSLSPASSDKTNPSSEGEAGTNNSVPSPEDAGKAPSKNKADASSSPSLEGTTNKNTPNSLKNKSQPASSSEDK